MSAPNVGLRETPSSRSLSQTLDHCTQDYVKELATMLLAHGEDQNSDGFRQLEDYVLKARRASINLLRSMSVRSFAQVLALKKRLSLIGQMSERIMLAMKLTPGQKRDYVAARKALVARNEEIKEKRRRVVATLEVGSAAGKERSVPAKLIAVGGATSRETK